MAKKSVFAVTTVLVAVVFSGGLQAAEDQQLNQRIEQLEQMLKQQQQRIVQLESSQPQSPDGQLNTDEQDEIRQLIRESLNDVELRSQLMGDVLSAGYDEGFFIRSSDNEYLFKINTLLQFRYYGINRGENFGAFGTGSTQGNLNDNSSSRLGPKFVPQRTDRSDFELERARIRFSGHIPSGLNDNPIEYYIQLGLGSDHEPDSLLTGKLVMEDEAGLDTPGELFDGDGEDAASFVDHLNQQVQDDRSHGVHLLDWYVQWQYAEWLKVKAGQYTMPFGRQETTAPEHLMLIDRSLANEMFNVGRSIGVGVLGDFLFLNQNMSYEVMIANGFHQQNRTEVAKEIDSLMAYAARVVWYMDGSSADDFADESALGHETGRYDELKLSAGLSFAYMDNNNRKGIFPPTYFAAFSDQDLEDHIIEQTDGFVGSFNDRDVATVPLGQFLLGNPIPTEVTQFGGDIAMKWQKLAMSAEWFLRIIDFDEGVTFYDSFFDDLNTADIDTLHQQGGYVQAGYFLTPKIELMTRLGGIWDNASDNVWEYAAGANYYIRGHDVKLSLDYTGTHEATTNSNDAGFGLNEEAGMWRGQLQVLF